MAHMAVVSKGKALTKVAKPLLSTSNEEARKRVLNLYRAWMREVCWTDSYLSVYIVDKYLYFYLCISTIIMSIFWRKIMENLHASMHRGASWLFYGEGYYAETYKNLHFYFYNCSKIDLLLWQICY